MNDSKGPRLKRSSPCVLDVGTWYENYPLYIAMHADDDEEDVDDDECGSGSSGSVKHEIFGFGLSASHFI